MQSSRFLQDSWQRFCQNRSSCLAAIFLIFLMLMAIFGPPVFASDYFTTNLADKNLPPSWHYLFGTDDLGRSMFVRIWCGARISLFVGITAAFIDVCIGILYGGFAAFYGKRVDQCMMRFADLVQSVPKLLIVILLTVIWEPGMQTVIMAIAITGWVNMARIIRSEVLALKTEDFVLFARSLGASSSYILLKHLIPNCIGSIITTLMVTIPHAIFVESFLSFLGLGVQAPAASWGMMASDGLLAISFYPWRLFFPAFFISTTMLSFHVLGDGFRDAFDPRLRR